jgi:hypothetical protein
MVADFYPAFSGERLTHNNVFYGELVDFAIFPGQVDCGCTVHYFNPKGVLVGREYLFVPYDRVRRHPVGLVWVQLMSCDWKPRSRIRQFVYELTCRIVTWFMRRSYQD